MRNSSSDRALGRSILFPNTRIGTFFKSELESKASSSSLDSAILSLSATSTKKTMTSTLGKYSLQILRAIKG